MVETGDLVQKDWVDQMMVDWFLQKRETNGVLVVDGHRWSGVKEYVRQQTNELNPGLMTFSEMRQIGDGVRRLVYGSGIRRKYYEEFGRVVREKSGSSLVVVDVDERCDGVGFKSKQKFWQDYYRDFENLLDDKKGALKIIFVGNPEIPDRMEQRVDCVHLHIPDKQIAKKSVMTLGGIKETTAEKLVKVTGGLPEMLAVGVNSLMAKKKWRQVMEVLGKMVEGVVGEKCMAQIVGKKIPEEFNTIYGLAREGNFDLFTCFYDAGLVWYDKLNQKFYTNPGVAGVVKEMEKHG